MKQVKMMAQSVNCLNDLMISVKVCYWTLFSLLDGQLMTANCVAVRVFYTFKISAILPLQPIEL
jgi:hypothetical protein